MRPLYGMAGLAEAGAASALVTVYCWLILVGSVALFAAWFRSRIAAKFAFVLLTLLTLMTMPWTVFQTVESDDPDVHSWASAEWTFGVCWMIVTVGVIAVTVWTFAFCRKQKAGDQPPVPPRRTTV